MAKKALPSVLTQSDVLAKSLARLSAVTERRNTVPILSYVKIEAGAHGLHLCATDLDMALYETVPAKVSGTLACTAPARRLAEVLRKVPRGAEIKIATEAGNLVVSSGAFGARIFTLPVVDFPALLEDDYACRFQMHGPQLRALLERVSYAISTEEARYYLNGIHLHRHENVLRAVATDGHRMGVCGVPLPAGAEEMPAVIVPRKALAHLQKLLSTYRGAVDVLLSPSRIRFVCGPVALVTKLIDGTFPDYGRVIPADNDKVVRIQKSAFLAAIGRVSAICNERARPVELSLIRDAIGLSARSVEDGDAAETLNGGSVGYAGDPFEIGFQARYLRDALAQVGEEVEFVAKDGSSPVIVRGLENQSEIHVLMPMRI